MPSFAKIEPSRNGEITLSFTDVGKSCTSREFFLTLFAKIEFSRKFSNLQYLYAEGFYRNSNKVRHDVKGLIN